jgi:(1->4)-alpha-D-glucan 1-alpha-D-glucosylmutase
MAKSLEDTLFYRFVRLLALNEVGGDPDHFGITPDHFHEVVSARARDWPHAMVATATHDTKRGEDARARLLALSEMPDAWDDALTAFQTISDAHLLKLEDGEAPDANDRYMLLQTLLGAWPVDLSAGSQAELDAFRARIEEYTCKALREAKRHSSWVHVNESYEEAALVFIGRLLDPAGDFVPTFAPLAQRLAYAGMLSGLARTVLKCTIPGVPDTYQGTELWDFSLVDPDNRRPVDYQARADALATEEDFAALLRNWRDGRIKQRILARLLADRAANPDFYAKADYRPLAARGAKARHVLAFRRSFGQESLVVAVPRLLTRFLEGENPPLGQAFWEKTGVPAGVGRWRDVVTGVEITSDETLGAGELFATLPIAVLRTLQ